MLLHSTISSARFAGVPFKNNPYPNITPPSGWPPNIMYPITPPEKAAIDIFQKTIANGGNRTAANQQFAQTLGKLTVPSATPTELQGFCLAQQIASEASEAVYKTALALTGNQDYADLQRAGTIFNISEQVLRSTEAGRAYLTRLSTQYGESPPDFNKPSMMISLLYKPSPEASQGVTRVSNPTPVVPNLPTPTQLFMPNAQKR